MNVKIIDKTERPIETIYRAFRVCYSKDVPTEIEIPKIRISGPYGIGREYKTDYDKMIEFIKDKMDLGHESPLEHVSFTFAIEGVSRALSHQLVRHRIASPSQQSQRYVLIEEFNGVIPPSIQFENNEEAHKIYANCLQNIVHAYNGLIKIGIPKEDARYLMPNACCTNLVMTFNLRSFRHFLSERLCKHAQWEIRELANKMLEEAERIVPFVGYKVKKCNVTCFQCKEGK